MKKSDMLGILLITACLLPAGAEELKLDFTGGSLSGLVETLRLSAAADGSDARAVPVAAAAADRGYVAGPPELPVEWVTIEGGSFVMGTDDITANFADAKPVHEVRVPSFEISKNLVTVAQYAQCVAKGKCTEAHKGYGCNWGRPSRMNHPINCVSWPQARTYADFMLARLPSESEWEYAATSRGQNQQYPWGNEAPDAERVVISTHTTMPVCSKPAGSTAQGVCDMSGHLYQWMADYYNPSYAKAPADGKPDASFSGDRVLRGAPFGVSAKSWRSDYRSYMRESEYSTTEGIGIRLARSTDFKWAPIPGGTFQMGSNKLPDGSAAAQPVHTVTLKPFELARAPVTVKEYSDCVSAGKCDKPGSGGRCNWGVARNADHPINCVTREQAGQYAVFSGARLPTEAEWEYAARNNGTGAAYPWGDAPVTSNLAVVDAAGTQPVCSRPAGNTKSGVCDLAGNVFQWVQDVFNVSYAGAPADGSAYTGPGNGYVMRGSPFNEIPGNPDNNNYTRSPGFNSERVGFRLARTR